MTYVNIYDQKLTQPPPFFNRTFENPAKKIAPDSRLLNFTP